jgi:hypothetical protein
MNVAGVQFEEFSILVEGRLERIIEEGNQSDHSIPNAAISSPDGEYA